MKILPRAGFFVFDSNISFYSQLKRKLMIGW
ncbi:Uncharacterised protein [Sphingobacterium thalpophilum]|uniref:Uncharacterized protein n=1 Tax=Sphingobacterium thalpophilum TaxID=259 RepID=A0A4U9VM74_9SPHI|nr:Uncharacterised protein [Sphingobacterium thalpophilum]